ncbi:hypothetical protein B0H11DRAFT_2235573 [Mycena galericulata]|nr:hypothetical protein B0H11DRAFT_2258448 [Mycena galericulata]KAJ7475306.1 hypothetical protein B0H11DRAFT_2235573 [Mycena galericulata]
MNMAEAFAAATGQGCHIYHSKDTRGRGGKRRQLTGLVAEVAWAIPVKEANDLGGKVPYVPGMPVFCTENIATELGISNGSPGTLVSVIFEEIEGRRYAISAEVDFRAYKNSNPDAPHPHRVTLKPVTSQIHFRLPNSATIYNATRSQLPLIPAFAFTSHNAQGRSLDVCCIDIAGCPTIQSAYVMLSRVRRLKGLCILRPFGLQRIRNHISEELRMELKRTELKAEITKAYSRERLSWFYGLVPEGQVNLLTRTELELDVDIAGVELRGLVRLPESKALRQYIQRDSTLADEIKARVGSWELPELPDDLPESGSRAEEEEDDEEGDDTDVSLAAVIHASLGEGLSAPARSRFEVERAEANDENRSRLTAGGEEEDVWSYDDEGRKWSEDGVPAAAQDKAESDESAND